MGKGKEKGKSAEKGQEEKGKGKEEGKSAGKGQENGKGKENATGRAATDAKFGLVTAEGMQALFGTPKGSYDGEAKAEGCLGLMS